MHLSDKNGWRHIDDLWLHFQFSCARARSRNDMKNENESIWFVRATSRCDAQMKGFRANCTFLLSVGVHNSRLFDCIAKAKRTLLISLYRHCVTFVCTRTSHSQQCRQMSDVGRPQIAAQLIATAVAHNYNLLATKLALHSAHSYPESTPAMSQLQTPHSLNLVVSLRRVHESEAGPRKGNCTRKTTKICQICFARWVTPVDASRVQFIHSDVVLSLSFYICFPFLEHTRTVNENGTKKRFAVMWMVHFISSLPRASRSRWNTKLQ